MKDEPPLTTNTLPRIEIKQHIKGHPLKELLVHGNTKQLKQTVQCVSSHGQAFESASQIANRNRDGSCFSLPRHVLQTVDQLDRLSLVELPRELLLRDSSHDGNNANSPKTTDAKQPIRRHTFRKRGKRRMKRLHHLQSVPVRQTLDLSAALDASLQRGIGVGDSTVKRSSESDRSSNASSEGMNSHPCVVIFKYGSIAPFPMMWWSRSSRE